MENEMIYRTVEDIPESTKKTIQQSVNDEVFEGKKVLIQSLPITDAQKAEMIEVIRQAIYENPVHQ